MDGIVESTLARMMNVGTLSFDEWSINNRGLWDKLPGALKRDIICQAEEAEVGQVDYIRLDLFRLFTKTGDRRQLEDIYFAKRRKLSTLVLAECIEDGGRFLEKIDEAIWAILSEPAWVIHAHNSYIRDTKALDTPLLERPILDLFACETGEILALTRMVLGDRLNSTLSADIAYELRRRILIPYITDHFWWMGGAGPVNNWSPWCTQNVLLSTLSLPSLTQKERMKVVRQAAATLDTFIASYGDDGGCDEGAGYYHAAALAMMGALITLEKVVGMDFTQIWSDSKIRAMAHYIEDVHIADDLYLNFADCSPKAGRLCAREFLFGKLTGQEDLMAHAASDVATAGWEEEDNNYNLFYKLIALSLHNEIMELAAKGVKTAKPCFKSFEKTQMGIWRKTGTTFALKGGSNGESHNHNDVGSIILYRGSKPLLIDIGVETYTKATFSDERYTLKPMRSPWHNLVNFGQIEQKAGARYHADVISMDESGASLDLARAYGDDRVKRYVRSVSFTDGVIAITDDFDCPEPAVLTLMSQERPHVEGDKLVFDSFSVSFDKDVSITTEPFPVTDARLRRAWPEMLYRTLISLPSTTTWTVAIKEES